MPDEPLKHKQFAVMGEMMRWHNRGLTAINYYQFCESANWHWVERPRDVLKVIATMVQQRDLYRCSESEDHLSISPHAFDLYKDAHRYYFTTLRHEYGLTDTIEDFS